MKMTAQELARLNADFIAAVRALDSATARK